MPSTNVTRRNKATNARVRFQWPIARLPSDASQPVPVPNCGREQAASAFIASAAPAPAWTTAVAAVFAVSAGALALEFLVLWSASARVIEQLPF
jgi:hypothetical protein